jgi:glycosyltransferase involved in cell wall biosynthesis
MQLKMAFYMAGGGDWTVGEVYWQNLLHALRRIRGEKMRFYLLTMTRHESTNGRPHEEADDLIVYDAPRRWSPTWVLNGALKRMLLRDVSMERFLKEHGINVVFGSAFTYKYPRVANLCWLPDFQHVHLPEMFSEREYLLRERAFLNSAKTATRIILMSEAVRRDFEAFAPTYAHKATVLHPISYVPESVYESDPHQVVSRYDLPERFVYLPNQFWKHKNHEAVFQAVRVLKGRGIKVYVVCTGNPIDYRHPSHFTDLFRKLSEWGIRDQVLYIGLIPRDDVLLLMRQSVCVLNPSLFEGWGYTVDEARSVGKRVLLSDIPAHREQNPPKATFFNPLDCDELSEKLGEIWIDSKPGPDTELEFEARNVLPERLRAYAEGFLYVAQGAFEEVRG